MPQEPTRYVMEGKEVWLCKGEEEGKLYWYDAAGKRHEVPDTFGGIRTF